MTDHEARLSAALAALASPAELEAFCIGLTRIPSPSGSEVDAAEYVHEALQAAGVRSTLQPIAPGRANVTARLASDSPGPALLLYASLDTAFSGDDTEDAPWIRPPRRQDFNPNAETISGHVVGLGAENPKAFVTAVVAAGSALAAAGGPEAGEVLMGIVSGGMPITHRPGMSDENIGFGTGGAHLLQRGFRPDYAIVVKPGWAVQTEETGLCWFRIDVHGTLSYTGTRHLLPYRNAIVDAGKVVVALEQWFTEYSERHSSEGLSPQGSIGAICAGHPGRTAFVPPVCSIFVDLRLDPEDSPLKVEGELVAALEEISRQNDGIEYDVTMLVSIPGGRSDPESRFNQAVIESWEQVEGEQHARRRGMSGISDAALLRGLGIPTAVVGLPQTPKPEGFAGFSMGVVKKENIHKLAELLIRASLAVCSQSFERERNEKG